MAQLSTRPAAPSLPHLGRPHVLREYALVADGERGALVGPRGEVAWMCFPGWDGDPVFASLLGAPALYAVSPVAPAVWGGWYEPGTLVWHSRWTSGASIVECREALAFPGARDRAVLLRRVEAVHGDARVAAVLDLRTDWGRRTLHLHRDGDAWVGAAPGLHLRWTGAAAAVACDHDGGGLELQISLAQGEHHDLVLELSSGELGAAPAPDALWAATAAAWHDAVPPLRTVAARDAQHACAVLRGLTTAEGGMVACATTSLPERAARGRDYDYRYAWLRDQCYAGLAGDAAEVLPLLDAAVRFTAERVLADGPGVRPMYRAGGAPVPGDGRVDLPGYPGAPEVHCGNAATAQFQLDVLGESLLLFAAAARRDRLDADARRAVGLAAEAVAQRWREPDSGVWELDTPRLWTHSRLICAAGLRAVAAAGAGDARDAERWRGLADALTGEAASRCVHRSGRWQRAPDDGEVDTSLLLAAIRGATPVDDPRARATLAAVRDELSEDGYVYRFRHGDQPLGEAEGAFLLCGFWTVLAELQQGHVVDAARRFERNRAACGPPGLFSEEYDVAQRQLRGNLPQAFVHALLLEAAARLSAVAEAVL